MLKYILIVLALFPTILFAGAKELHKLVQLKAAEYSVSAPLMEKMITCESKWDTTIQSKHLYQYNKKRLGIVKGTRERSFGLVQINIDWNPQVTEKQAKDPVFAVDYLAKKLKQGKGDEWSCFPQPMKQIKPVSK